MKQRCLNPRATNYPHYGGAGITICDRWRDSFAHFLADMGECPDAALTLERIDNARGYEPGNCRWATRAEQNRHRSHCRPLTFQGRTQIVTAWAAELGIAPNVLLQRLYLGWSVERTLSTPKKPQRKQSPQ